HETRINDPRPFGEVIGDAVLSSVQTLVMIGGFIILFSVFTKLLFLIGISPIIAHLFEFILSLLSLLIELGLPLLSGLFEITLGAQIISHIETDSFFPRVFIVRCMLWFSGFSVYVQVASIIAKTDIWFTRYFLARFLHRTFASILTFI